MLNYECMTLQVLTKKITLLEQKLAQLECRVNVSHSSLSTGRGREWMIKYPILGDSKLKTLNEAITKSAGILKSNKKIPKDAVAWQKQIRKEWSN